MQSLHFGAGNIGRGLIGKLLSNSGYHVIFSDISETIVDAINYYKKYSIKLIGNDQEKEIIVNNISAVHIKDIKIIEMIAMVNLITTAVGFNVLKNIAKTLAKGIIFKIKTHSNLQLNILACENYICSSSYLKKEVLKNLPEKYHSYLENNIGFIDCSIDKIVPAIPVRKNNDLSIIAEDFQEWIVDSKQFKGTIPNILDMQFSDNLISFIERKLFTVNTGHAITAYLGLCKKYKMIRETILDKKIRNIVKSAMIESGNVLIRRYNFKKEEHLSYINKILLRFENPFVLDKLERIARNPLQKLSIDGRLIKPILGAKEYSLPYIYLIKGIAAALYYYNINDLESIKIYHLIKKQGILKTLSMITGLNINSKEIYDIFFSYHSLIEELS